MAKLKQIDKERPSFLTGNRTSVSSDPQLTAFAKKHSNERMKLVSSVVTNEITLSSIETKVLLEWVDKNEWRFHFERNLQSLSAKPDGDLLTTWMPFAEFKSFVFSNKHEGPVALRELLHRITNETKNWAALGVEEVYFDGYELQVSNI